MKIIIYIIVIAFAGRFYFFFLENRNLYFPISDIEQTPASIGLVYEDLFINTEDGETINAWFIPCKDAKATVIFCHGNAGNISHRLYTIEGFHRLGLNVLIFDYRGYGKSSGRPKEKGLYLDVLAVYNYLIKDKKIPQETIIVFGRSLGGSVGIDLATKVPLRALISDSTFSSTVDMGKKIYPLLPIQWFITQKYDSVSKVLNIALPKLFFHSIDDDIVPYELGEKLYKAARQPKEFIPMRGGHNEAVMIMGDAYFKRIEEFLKKYEVID